MSEPKIPESGRLILLQCDDFMGIYTVEGMFIDYKNPIKKGKKIFTSRFCTFDNLNKQWVSNRSEWSNKNSWDYKMNGGEK